MKDDELKKYTEANRESWNEVTPIHRKNRKVNLKEEFKKPHFSVLDDIITNRLKEFGIEGSEAAQLSCNNGQETLSLVSIGARHAVGFDISDEAIKDADELKEISGLNCEFVRTDVYDIGDEYKGNFDFIFITIGSLYWLPDLPRFFGIVYSMLKPKGLLVIYEGHPFTNMLAHPDEEEFDPDDLLKIAFPYFRSEPWVDNDGIDYLGKTKYQGKTNYGWPYKSSDIINGVIGAGLTLKEFTEYPHSVAADLDHLPQSEMVPLSYILTAQK
jgi:SAM-dependent methyltransferase